MLKLAVVVPILLTLVGLRVARAGQLWWVLALWIGLFSFFHYGFTTPIPSSAIQIYLAIGTLALFAYVTSSPDRLEAVVRPLVAFAGDGRYTLPLLVVAVALPAGAALRAKASLNVSPEPPFFARTVHPAPPTSITVHDQAIDLVAGDSPFRPLEKSDPAAYQQHVESGKRIYYQNCFYCHGDALGGDGMYAHGLNPAPANLVDVGVLPNFQETFFFWRVSKGGPGMPDEGGPGDSAMPEWERFLSNDQIWEVILFLYDHTGYKPRAIDAHVHAAKKD